MVDIGHVNNPRLVGLSSTNVDNPTKFELIDRMPISAADIRAARARVDETQTQFASRFGVDRSTVAFWERRGLPTKGAAPRMIEQELRNIVGEPKGNKDGGTDVDRK
jgi:DNA-binding transcriptional regulator YiaG